MLVFSISDINLKQTERLCVWVEMWVSIRQAAFRSLCLHSCRNFTHYVDICIYFCTILIKARFFLHLVMNWRCHEGNGTDIKMYDIRQCPNEIQNGWTPTCKINSCLSEYKAAVSASTMRVYVFWPDSNAACKTGIYTIHSLDFQIFLRSPAK